MAVKVIFTEEQLKSALKMKKSGGRNSDIAKMLNTSPCTTTRHILEYEAFGYEEYKRLRTEPNDENRKIEQLKKNLQAMFTKTAIMMELIMVGDIELCKEFITKYEGEDYKSFNSMDGVIMEDIIYKLRLSIDSKTRQNRFAAVAFER